MHFIQVEGCDELLFLFCWVDFSTWRLHSDFRVFLLHLVDVFNILLGDARVDALSHGLLFRLVILEAFFLYEVFL